MGLFRNNVDQLVDQNLRRYEVQRKGRAKRLSEMDADEVREMIVSMSYFDTVLFDAKMRDTPEVIVFLKAVRSHTLEQGDLEGHIDAFVEAEKRLGHTWSDGFIRPGNRPIFLEMNGAQPDEPTLQELVARLLELRV